MCLAGVQRVPLASVSHYSFLFAFSLNYYDWSVVSKLQPLQPPLQMNERSVRNKNRRHERGGRQIESARATENGTDTGIVESSAQAVNEDREEKHKNRFEEECIEASPTE